MSKRLYLLLTIWLVILPKGLTGAQESRPADTREAALRVLFIGNSYTYYNNLPAMVEAIAEADDALPRIETRMIAPGGESMAGHWETEATMEAIRSGGWDFVVLQSQSTFDEYFLVRGQARVNGFARFHEYAAHLIDEIRTTGATPVLYMQWRRRDASRRDINIIRRAHGELAQRTGARVAPVGEAFELLRESHPDLDLYDPDGSHPSPAGTLLAAQVLVRSLTERMPTEAPTRLSGPAIDYDTELAQPDEIVELVSVSNADAKALQTAAGRAKLHDPAGDPPAPDNMPTLPEGHPLDPHRLVGVWRGPLDVYPTTIPCTLEIRVSQDVAGWSLKAEISFEGGRPNPIVPTIEGFEITPTGLRFTDAAGPSGGIVRYQANFTGEALEGIAEIIVEGELIYGIGGWKVTKVND